MIDQPGIYDIPAEAYHADPVGPAPSLSSSIAKVLLTQSARHAWWAHPRLNPEPEREEKEAFDIGTALHAYLLEGETGFVIVDAKDWRTKDAQVHRDLARMEGKTPLLAARWADVQRMAAAAKRQLDDYQDAPRPLTAGKAEQTIVWEEQGVWCRARLDWLHDDHRTIDDLKSTGASAQPDAWTRTLFNMGFDIQAAFYRRGLRAVTGTEATFRFVPVETFAPFALSVVALAPDALALADRKVGSAIAQWGHCLATGRWPAYPTVTCWADLPPWQEAQWMERELRAEGIRDDGRPIGDQLAGMGDGR